MEKGHCQCNYSRILRWEDEAGLSEWAQPNDKDPYMSKKQLQL